MGIVSEDVFTEVELSRVSFRWRGDFFTGEICHVGVFHGINSPKGIFCGSNSEFLRNNIIMYQIFS
jgi:hypothetical protein